MASLQQSKRSQNALWKEGEVFLIENLTLFLIPRRGRKYSHTNSYILAMTPITQDDHLTAGAWAACTVISLFESGARSARERRS